MTTVVILIAGIVVLAAVVLLAVGRGGELSVERSDYAPLDLGPVSATDVVLLRPPTALWGYNVHATDEAFEQIADSIRERDVRIVALEQLVSDLSRERPTYGPPARGPYVGARYRWRDAAEPAGQAADGGWRTGTEPAADLPAAPEQSPEQSPEPSPEQSAEESQERFHD